MVSFKICPICGTRAHRSAQVCSTCGASLSDVPETTARSPRPASAQPELDRRYGEVDLLEGEAHQRGSALFGVLLGGIALLLVVVAVPLIISFMQSREPIPPTVEVPVSPTAPILLETNTPAPTPVIATVTPPPPTPTQTYTPAPCTHIVQPGDDLISIIYNCGHRSLDVEPLVLQLNKLSSPELIQLGQEIIVPWPTPTPDPNAAAQVASAPDVQPQVSVAGVLPALQNPAISFLTPPGADAPAMDFATQTPFITEEPTLLPGIGYHIVQPNESMVAIAIQYHTNAETLSQLNPEIPFSQCDFGLDSGGERCTVLLVVGQQLRVPVPTPTPTLSPTLSGSETPTPSATPTFNAPSLVSPTNRVFFLRNDLITLRWVGTGVLGEEEAYLVQVEDVTSGAVFQQQTRDLFFIIPTAWQSDDAAPHDYRWSIGVVKTADASEPYFVTDPRLFTWEGRTEASG